MERRAKVAVTGKQAVVAAGELPADQAAQWSSWYLTDS